MTAKPSPDFSRKLELFVDTPRAPGRSHRRTATQKFRAEAPPQASFGRKLSAFLMSQVLGWVGNYLKFRFGPKHKFETYDILAENGIYPLAGDSIFTGAPGTDEEIRISLAGDWGTGTLESNSIAELIGEQGEFKPHYTVHLGDVYYVGDESEVEQNCLGQFDRSGGKGVTWPIGSVGGFALNGNHEMYANGNAYFDSFLPVLGLRTLTGGPPGKQKASYFCLQNDSWTVIGLDTGYNSVGLPIIEKIPFFRPSCKLPAELLDWLKNTVRVQDDHRRGLVLLSHHQYYSSFDEIYAKPGQQLKDLIDRPVLWFWGHEHRMALYGKHAMKDGIEAYGRCVGHGGMPIDINMDIKTEGFPLVLYDNREYERLDANHAGFNGYVNLTFKGSELLVEYRDIRDDLLVKETWEVRDGDLVGKEIALISQDEEVRQVADLGVAIGRS